jgi:hypothetical protein
MLPLLWKTGIVYDPRHHRTGPLHGWERLLPHLFQHCLVIPRCVGHQMVERLVHPSYIPRRQARGHWLDTLAITGQKQSRAVIFQRNVTICMSRGIRQTLHICRKALLLWAWRGEA